MGRKIGGAALLLLSALMLLGFARSGASMGSPTTLFALLITVALPAAGGIALLRGALGGNSKAKMQLLRQQTIDAEILRLAMAQRGKLTAVQVASALALPEGEAKSSLDSLVMREVADLDVTDDGVLVYSFHDARYFDNTDGKGILGG
ncbi:MAG: hypothetical protein ABIT20_26550 [Gemmatimonadaceae bacterium]